MSAQHAQLAIPSDPKGKPSLLQRGQQRSTGSIVRTLERIAFKYGNKLIMVPLLQMGCGRFMGSPPTGYFLLLQTTGRKSHQPRVTPLNYAIDCGCVICLAGFGEHADWLANIRADPHVHVRLPDRLVEGIATEVKDLAEARCLAVQVARNCGFALVFEHPRCLVMSDTQLAAQLNGRPVVRIQPVDAPVVAGAYDPGGQGWILPMLIQCLALLGIITLHRRKQQAMKIKKIIG
jgi:deazaflavin-dependent oxidoreductase (nitroreductase family)